MILQSLTQYYEELVKRNEVTSEGWCKAKVSFALNINEDGSLFDIIPKSSEKIKGKKTVKVPAEIDVPQMVTRSGIKPNSNFLCDNAKYFLGLDEKEDSQRARDCFEAAKQKHIEILQNVETPMAKAIVNFFTSWKPEFCKTNPYVQRYREELLAGGNFVFEMDKSDAVKDSAIQFAWNQYRNREDQGEIGICLVTGRREPIARTHMLIKGVPGAQSSGAALVSFNADSFSSYGKEQSYNAPVSTHAVYAYTTALNYLLSNSEYASRLGDMMVVCWAKSAEAEYPKVFSWSMAPTLDNQKTVSGVFKNLSKHRMINLDGIELDPNQEFYVLGLSPNAARLVVRLFYMDSFGNVLKNIANHYKRMEIIHPSYEQSYYLGVWRMLQETINQKSKDKNPPSNLPGAVMQAILSGGRYPEELYYNTLMRIRVEQGNITSGRAAIIKACLIRNYKLEKGDDFVELNENCTKVPYILGRTFALLEWIQEMANPGINTTIRDRYFNSASATPAVVFPTLLKLDMSHMNKLKKDPESMKRNFARRREDELTDLLGKIKEFPNRLDLEQQGQFILGYYHQKQARYNQGGQENE